MGAEREKVNTGPLALEMIYSNISLISLLLPTQLSLENENVGKLGNAHTVFCSC